MQPTETRLFSTKLYKDALAFRLLRMQGYHVNPSTDNFLVYTYNTTRSLFSTKSSSVRRVGEDRFLIFGLLAGSFCWFLQHPDFLDYIVKNYEHQTSMLYAVHRATDLMFNGEFELEEARSFSRKLLAKSTSMVENIREDNIVIFPGLQKLVSHCHLLHHI